MTAASRRVLLGATLFALALHLLLWKQPMLRRSSSEAAPAAAPVHLRVRIDLVPLSPPPAAAPPVVDAAPADPSTPRRAARTVVARQAAARPSSDVLPVTTSPRMPAIDPLPAPAGTSPVAATPAPLDLRLPATRLGEASAPGARSQALNDPRGNDRRSADERFGRAFAGVAGRSEEQLADGTVRIRSGTSCMLAHPARSAGLDPYNNAVRTFARHVEAC